MQNRKLTQIENKIGRFSEYKNLAQMGLAILAFGAILKGVEKFEEYGHERLGGIEMISHSGLEQKAQDSDILPQIKAPEAKEIPYSIANPNMPYMDTKGTDEFAGQEEQAYRGLIYDKKTKSWNSITPEAKAPEKITPKIREYNPASRPIEETLYANSKSRVDNLISNEFFRNSQYLNEKQIKQLLVDNNSCLQNTGVEKTIIKAAQDNEINPIYILARLQQEQRLITKEKASKNALNYATGYGARDDKKLASAGLNYQVRKTAEKLDEFADEFDGTQTVKINYGQNTIKPENKAQYALYRYTPHTDGFNLSEKLLTRLDKQINN